VAADVNVLEPCFVPFQSHVPVSKVDPAGAKRLHLGPGQHQPRLVRLIDEVVVEGSPVDRDVTAALLRHGSSRASAAPLAAGPAAGPPAAGRTRPPPPPPPPPAPPAAPPPAARTRRADGGGVPGRGHRRAAASRRATGGAHARAGRFRLLPGSIPARRPLVTASVPEWPPHDPAPPLVGHPAAPARPPAARHP